MTRATRAQNPNSDGYWWLECKWQKHRRIIEDVHPLLVRAQEALGVAWMSLERVLAVLDADDPAAVVEGWLGNPGAIVGAWLAKSRSRACGNCHASFKPNSPNQKLCEACRPAAYRRGSRERMRRSRLNRRSGVTNLTGQDAVPARDPRTSKAPPNA